MTLQDRQTHSTPEPSKTDAGKIFAAICGLAAYLVLLRRSYFATMLHANTLENGLLEPYYALFLALTLASSVAAFFVSKKLQAEAPSRHQRRAARLGLALLSVLGSAVVFFATSNAAVNPIILAAGVIVFSLGTVSLALLLTTSIVSMAESKKTIGIIVTLAYLLSTLITLGSTLVPDSLKLLFVVCCPLLSCAAWLACGGGNRSDIRFSLKADGGTYVHDLGFLSAIYLICSIMLGCNFTPSLSAASTPVYFGTHGLLLAACFLLLAVFVFAPDNRRSVFIFELIGIVAFIALFFFSALLDSEWISLSANVIASARLCFELLLWIAVLCILTGEKISAFMGASAFLALRVVSDALVNLAIPQFVALFGEAATSTIHKVALALFFLTALGFAAIKIIEFAKGTEYARAPENESQRFSESCELLIAQFKLSKREGEILQYVARGYSSRWIAETLCISVSTVQSHTKSIYRKLGIHNKQELLELVSPVDKTNSGIQ